MPVSFQSELLPPCVTFSMQDSSIRESLFSFLCLIEHAHCTGRHNVAPIPVPTGTCNVQSLPRRAQQRQMSTQQRNSKSTNHAKHTPRRGSRRRTTVFGCCTVSRPQSRATGSCFVVRDGSHRRRVERSGARFCRRRPTESVSTQQRPASADIGLAYHHSPSASPGTTSPRDADSASGSPAACAGSGSGSASAAPAPACSYGLWSEPAATATRSGAQQRRTHSRKTLLTQREGRRARRGQRRRHRRRGRRRTPVREGGSRQRTPSEVRGQARHGGRIRHTLQSRRSSQRAAQAVQQSTS